MLRALAIFVLIVIGLGLLVLFGILDMIF